MEQMRNFAQVIPAQAEPLVSGRQSAHSGWHAGDRPVGQDRPPGTR
jgi:hypothetical protein